MKHKKATTTNKNKKKRLRIKFSVYSYQLEIEIILELIIGEKYAQITQMHEFNISIVSREK